MFDESKISQLLQDSGIPFVGEIVRDNAVSETFFVHVNVSRDSKNRQVPSNGTLNKVREIAASNGVSIEFLLKDSFAQDIETGLRATLIHAFPNDIRNVFLSATGKTADVWFDPKGIIEEPTRQDLEQRVKLFLDASDFQLRTLNSTANDERLPGKLALLQVVRAIAPASVLEIKSELERKEFEVPSDDWLNRRLDALRKTNVVVRLGSGKYAVSLQSLRNLGTEIRGRRSPDVSRLLALARKDQ